MARLFWFKFFPECWFGDADLQACSLEAKGLWIQMLARMFECSVRGRLSSCGIPWSLERLSRAVGACENDTKKALDELLSAGVLRVDSDGSYYCNKMMQYEHIREVNAVNGSKGGRPKKAKQKRNKSENLSEPLVSNSNSISNISSLQEGGLGEGAQPEDEPPRTKLPKPPVELCERIYQAYPRKVGHGAALKSISSALIKLLKIHGNFKTAGEWLLSVVETYAAMRREYIANDSNDSHKFTPMPSTWFNQERYLDPPPEPKPAKVFHFPADIEEREAREAEAAELRRQAEETFG